MVWCCKSCFCISYYLCTYTWGWRISFVQIYVSPLESHSTIPNRKLKYVDDRIAVTLHVAKLNLHALSLFAFYCLCWNKTLMYAYVHNSLRVNIHIICVNNVCISLFIYCRKWKCGCHQSFWSHSRFIFNRPIVNHQSITGLREMKSIAISFNMNRKSI